ncbi:MAG: hypothetical protein RIQ60_1836 [Pseudomonadota bacterium]|jgi:hypothetical protein
MSLMYPAVFARTWAVSDSAEALARVRDHGYHGVQ